MIRVTEQPFVKLSKYSAIVVVNVDAFKPYVVGIVSSWTLPNFVARR